MARHELTPAEIAEINRFGASICRALERPVPDRLPAMAAAGGSAQSMQDGNGGRNPLEASPRRPPGDVPPTAP